MTSPSDNSDVNPLIKFAVNKPNTISRMMWISTLLIIMLAVLPSIWPKTFSSLEPLTVDTDPENMLSPDEPVRLFHNRMKKEFSLNDIVVVGVVNDKTDNGVYTPETLSRVFELTEFAKTLSWPDKENPELQAGVVEVDMIAPSTVENIEQGGLGSVKFSWLMPEPPTTQTEALAVRDRAMNIPFLKGTLVSEDGKAIALYLPLTDKHLSYEVREALLNKIDEWGETEESYYITGLPVAEDTFGVEMFYQMAISAPLAMLVIFLLLWWFFKKLIFVVSPMIIAMVCALTTMGLLIISGNTIHIMSSMIPIFIMPIAVLDAIHILSDFFDRYPKIKDRRKTLIEVMKTLFAPMLFTTLTTIAGFASLALTPIPPVQVFGIFVAIGVFFAWFWTITFIPAFIMFIPEEKLAAFANHGGGNEEKEERTAMGRFLKFAGNGIYKQFRLILVMALVATGVAGYGISKININDNPIKWFGPDHSIRIADRVMNKHFAGTYMAYLELEQAAAYTANNSESKDQLVRMERKITKLSAEEVPSVELVFTQLAEKIQQISNTVPDSPAKQASLLSLYLNEQLDNAPDDEFDAWDQAQLFIDSERQRSELFKQPELLEYMAEMQTYLTSLDAVGKANSLTDVVKTVHRELLLGDEKEFRIPETSNAVAQTLITYQNSHRPQDLWHFVTPDYRKSSLWLQLKSGDNQDMSFVEESLAAWMKKNPPPMGIEANWFGLTHINVAWQEKMVNGMIESFAGSFLVVLIMMTILFRSLLWGLLAMIPLTVTVGLIYGVIGLIGKDYDMPVAILSALSLGLAVDYAIHFLARSRETVNKIGSWKASVGPMFGEPARAISRNVIVVGFGFLPLLAAPLVPYQTVGIFIAAILFLAGIASLMILPAMITLLERFLFPGLQAKGITEDK
ncbi:MAG: RND transporter [Gammaproteobacteria bacterium]|nr:MAG: RND transporter [Gammaproteobacteria bacterium]